MLKGAISSDNFSYLLISLPILVILFLFAKRRTDFRRPFIVVSILYNIVYLLWRTLYTIPLHFGITSLVLGVILLLAEWMGFWQSLTTRLLFWKPFQYQQWPPKSFADAPTVDVFIATYNENMQILRRTIAGCQNMDYPADYLNIYLCDDGARTEARALAEELGIHYLSRKDRSHAKAGNINNALSQSNGEFVMLLDADMVPKSAFLAKVMGYFTDEHLGFVQTPQVFYNPDPFQYNLKMDKHIPNEQDFFMMDIQAGRDTYNAVLHVGTNAVFRRKALEDIGGIPTGTITEDMATGMLIQAHGYKTKFVKEVLCTGLSVESFTDLVKQRERWCRGNIQVAKKWKPLTIPGLTLAQRLIYFDGLVYWFFGVQKLIFVLCPLIYMIFNVVILKASVHDLLLFWFPSFSASVLTFRTLVKKSRTITWSHIYEVAMAPYLALSAVVEALFSRPIPFRVTPKGTNSEKRTFSVRTALPHILLLIITILGWIMIIQRFNNSSADVNSMLINGAWSIYNVFAILISIFVCMERPRMRSAERLATHEKIELSIDEQASCQIVDLSETGAKVSCGSIRNADSERSDSVSIFSESLGELNGKVVWSKKEKGQHSFGIRFGSQNHEKYRNIIKFIANHSRGYHDDK